MKWAIALVLFILALSLRLYHFENRAPFDWDQNRDYTEVRRIASGEPVVLGPVAKGAGGFYLGSLYYYMLYPAYSLFNGNLRALPLTSIFLDSLVVGAVFMLLTNIWSLRQALILSILWGGSFFVIDAARISWNVVLIPLWSLGVIFSLYGITNSTNKQSLYLLGLLAGLSFHIHVTAIPLIPIAGLVFLRHFRYPLSSWLITAIFALLPLTPLLAYDMTHAFANLRLAKALIAYQASQTTGLWDMLIMGATKLGKVLQGLLLSRFVDSVWLGISILLLAVQAMWRSQGVVKIAGLFVIISYSLVVALHDYGFPEYYFAICYLAMLILVIHWITKMSWLTYPLLGFFFILQLQAYTIDPTPFGLGVKEGLVNVLKEYTEPIDVQYVLSPGREGGFGYLLEQANIQSVQTAKTKVVITDNITSPVYIKGELAEDRAQLGRMKIAVDIVQ